MNAKVVVTGAMFALFLAALEQTIVSTALPAIMADLGRVELGSWVITAYLVSVVCATPALGKLSDLYGRAVVLRTCIALFVAGSMACAAAPSMPMLIAGRAVQGVGGGGLLVMAQTIVGDAVPPRERGRFAAWFSIVWTTASLLGPLLGGLLAEHTGWRWIFWINLPLGALATVLAERGLRELAPTRRPAHVDVMGSVLLSIASVGVLMLASRSRILSWDGAAAIVAVASAASLLLFVRRQRRVPEPIVPADFLRDPVIAPVLVSTFLVYGSYLSLSVMLPLYFQLGLGRSSAESGSLLVPMMVMSSVTAFLAGRYTRTHGRYRPPPLATLPVAIVACVLLAIAAPHGSAWTMSALGALFALGIGAIFPCTIVAAQAAAGRRHLGAISGAITLVRALGASVATGLLMAVLFHMIARGLPEASTLQSLEDLVRRPMDTHARSVVLSAFAVVAWIETALLTAGFLAFLRLEDVELADAGWQDAAD